MLTNDVILTTNEWIEMLIDGSVLYSVTGLQSRLGIIYPDKGIIVEFAYDGYMLPRESNYGRELQNPIVAVINRFRMDGEVTYWKDKLPKSEDIGWTEGLSIRFDVWGRTPPETREISDSVWGCLKLMKRQLWAQTRTGLVSDSIGEVDRYVDKLEGVPDLWHRSINTVLGVFKIEESD